METKDKDGTGGGGQKTWATIAKNSLSRAIRENRETFCHLFDAVSADVMAETEPDKIYVNLQRVIEISLMWQKDIDSRAEEQNKKRCIARVPDNGDNIACDQLAQTGDFCEKHSV